MSTCSTTDVAQETSSIKPIKPTGCCGKLLRATRDRLLSAIAIEQFGSYEPGPVYINDTRANNGKKDELKKDDKMKPEPFEQFAKAAAGQEKKWGSSKFGSYALATTFANTKKEDDTKKDDSRKLGALAQFAKATSDFEKGWGSSKF